MNSFKELNDYIAKQYGATPSDDVEEAISEFVYGIWGESLEAVERIVNWYKNTPAPPLHLLMENRKQLVTHNFFITAMVGQAGKVYRSYYIKRKNEFSERTIKNIDEFGAVSKSEHKARLETAKLQEKEAEAEASYDKGKMLLRSIDLVINAMLQDIAELRSERHESN